MGRHNKERQKEMDAGCSLWESRKVRRREEKNRRTEKKKDIMKTEKICTLQTFKKSQCLMTKTKLTNKADQKSFPLNGRNIRVIGTSLDPSTLSGQKRLFIVKDCFHPAKDCSALTFGKQPARSWGKNRISSNSVSLGLPSGTTSIYGDENQQKRRDKNNCTLVKMYLFLRTITWYKKDWAVQLEVAAARRRQAQEVSRRQARNIVRHGFGRL